MISRRYPLVLIITALMAACSAQSTAPVTDSPSGDPVNVKGGAYTNITPAQLAEMLKNKDFFFANTHIPYEGEIEQTDAFIPYVVLFLSRVTSPAGNPVVINGTAVPPAPALNADRVAHGASLYQQYCAECHGANLEGAADWKRRLPDGSLPPPPHDSSGHTWHHPDSLLLSIIADGGNPADNSKMPAFKDRLHDDQIIAILEFLKSKWGGQEREFQWWITATQDRP